MKKMLMIMVVILMAVSMQAGDKEKSEDAVALLKELHPTWTAGELTKTTFTNFEERSVPVYTVYFDINNKRGDTVYFTMGSNSRGRFDFILIDYVFNGVEFKGRDDSYVGAAMLYVARTVFGKEFAHKPPPALSTHEECRVWTVTPGVFITTKPGVSGMISYMNSGMMR